MGENKMKNEKEAKKELQEPLGWKKIIELLGTPLWDYESKKWRILDGYKCIIGNDNKTYLNVSFTDTKNWIDFEDVKLYTNVIYDEKENKK